MATFSDRLPSRHDIYLLFGACVLPVQAQALFSYLNEFPSLLRHMTVWDALSAGAYSFTFALFESLVLLLALALLAILLPARWLKDDFASKGSVALYALLPWLVYSLSTEIVSWPRYILLSAGYLLLLSLLYLLLRRVGVTAGSIKALLERVSLLAYLHVVLDVFSLLVVIVRNL